MRQHKRQIRALLGIVAALSLILGSFSLAYGNVNDPDNPHDQEQSPSENSEAEITVTFSADCTDFEVESTKDISFVSINYSDDFTYEKFDNLSGHTFSHQGDKPIKSIVVKSGTTMEVFECDGSGGETDPAPRDPECADGIDNDLDGLTDHPKDPGCETPDDDDERDPTDGDDDTEGPQGDETCDDGVDNDGDGLVDDEDPDCNEGAQDGEFCDDGEDNDGDGLTDGDDPDCQDDGTEGPQGDETCDDGVDNDGDGLVDDEDPDCNEGAQDGEFCDDGIDNDGDGLTDDEDPDCQPDPCTAAAGDPGILTDDTLGQTLWDGGADALSPVTEDPDADGVVTGQIYDGGNGTELEPVTDEVACLGDLAVDQDTFPVDP